MAKYHGIGVNFGKPGGNTISDELMQSRIAMPNYHAISSEHHGQKRWKRYSSYAFAAADAVAPLTAVELPSAMMSMPIAFVESDGCFVPVAVLGLQPGMNLFVTSDWRWVGNYIPAVFRAYPFRLANTEGGKQVLCIDEDSGLISDGPAGESFFTAEGQPTQAIQDSLNFLSQLEQSRIATAAACAALQKHAVLRSWSITVKTGASEQQVAGLHQIDEAALNALSGEAFLEIRQAGALPVAYCQLLSMQQLPRLGQLAEANAKAADQASQNLTSAADQNLAFFSNNGTINFGGLL